MSNAIAQHKGWCVRCKISTASLHKCQKCGGFVMYEFDARDEHKREIRHTVKAIRGKYLPIIANKTELIPALRNNEDKVACQAEIDELKRKMGAEVEAYLSPGVKK